MDLAGDGPPRIAGTVVGPIEVLAVADEWALVSRPGRLTGLPRQPGVATAVMPERGIGSVDLHTGTVHRSDGPVLDPRVRR